MIGCFFAGLVTLTAFEVQSVPLTSPEAHAFAARIEASGHADLLVLDQRSLTVYPEGNPARARVVPLCEGASAVDIADTDGDGRSDLIVVCGERILRYRLHGEAPPEAEELFQLDTPFAAHHEAPFLNVLVVQYGGRTLLALPREDRLELRSFTGRLVETFGADDDSAALSGFGGAFLTRTIDPPQAALPGGLEFRASSSAPVLLELPQELLPPQPQGLTARRGTPRQLVEAAARPAEAWPWFPLRTTGAPQERVLYAAGSPALEDTLLRIRRPRAATAPTPEAIIIGPPRRYPGMLLLEQEQLPDFNGDGFVDVLLWKSAEPSLTVGAVARAIAAGTWPLWLTVHLFSDEIGRYEPRPAARVRVEADIRWFLQSPAAAPLRHVVLADFNGDGRTDLGCSLAADTYSVWFYGEDGFRGTPDFQKRLPEPIESIAFTAQMGTGSETSIALRSASALYLLRAGR